jgi:hypothetical protein
MVVLDGALGRPPIRTVQDVVDYLTACGLITVDSDEGEPRYRMHPAPRLPGEVLNLPRHELDEADRWRWARLHEPATRRIIGLFTDDADQPSSASPANSASTSRPLAPARRPAPRRRLHRDPRSRDHRPPRRRAPPQLISRCCAVTPGTGDYMPGPHRGIKSSTARLIGPGEQ